MDTTSKSSNNLVSYNLPYNNLIYNKLQQIGEKADKRSGQLTVVIESCYEAEKLQWSSTDQGKFHKNNKVLIHIICNILKKMFKFYIKRKF